MKTFATRDKTPARPPIAPAMKPICSGVVILSNQLGIMRPPGIWHALRLTPRASRTLARTDVERTLGSDATIEQRPGGHRGRGLDQVIAASVVDAVRDAMAKRGPRT